MIHFRLSKQPFLCLLTIFLLEYNSALSQIKKNAGLASSGLEMSLPVREYTAGLHDLHRAFHDMTYTVLAQKKFTYFKKWEEKIKEFPFESFSREAKVDYVLLANQIDKDKYHLTQQQNVWHALQPVLPFSDQILRLVKMRHWGQVPDAKRVAATYDSIGNELLQVQKKLDRVDLSAIHALPVAIRAVKSLRSNLKEVYRFYNGYDPSFTWWVATSFKKTDSLFATFIDSLHVQIEKNLASHDGSGIPGVPIGRKNIEKLLHLQMIPYSPEELIDIAHQEYAWCLREMKKASEALGYKTDWKAAVEEVKNDYVEVGKQPALVDSLQWEAIDFIEKHHLIRLPALAKKTWTMKMMTPKEQLINPFFYGGRLISISYPTNTMQYSDKLESMRGNNIYFSRATVFHELIPGHYLQFYMNERYRPYRRPFHTPYWTEGWSFYWEMLLWDKGFDKTPEQKIGALYWRMTRCARIVFSLNFHLEKWTPGKCVQYLIDKADLEPANARAEVKRSFGGGYNPLYQVAYMIGALQFRALRHELVDSGNLPAGKAGMSSIDFHQSILEQNNMPIEMVRVLLEDIPVEKNYQPHWKFYKEIAAK